MKKTILALVLAAMSSGVRAEWVKVAESVNDDVFYLNSATIRKDGNLRRFWSIVDSKERDKGGSISRRSLFEFDCKEERSRLLSYSYHSEPLAGGKVLKSSSTTGDNWAYIAPDTVKAAMLKIVCAR